jgi:hypothetical protein
MSREKYCARNYLKDVPMIAGEKWSESASLSVWALDPTFPSCFA